MQRERDYLPFLEKLVGFATVSADSNLPLIDYAEGLLQAQGYATRRICNEAGDKANLLARIGPEVPGGIALAGHTDVVPVSGQDWLTDPFTLVEGDGKFTGRGTSDMKGFIALALAAAVSIDARRLAKPLHLVLTYDEEIGCLGAMALQETLRSLPDLPRFALIGEPTGMQLVTAHKGIQNLATRVHGRPAHSSRPDLGASAIAFAARFIAGIGDALPRDADPAYDPPTATFNVGTIQGGEAVNIIPEWCEFGWEFRHLPDQDPKRILEDLASRSSDLRLELQGISEETRVRASVPGLVPGANRDVVDELKQFLSPPEPRITAVPFVTEGGLFQQVGIPSVICGPGLIEQAHQPNEWVSVQAMDTYRDFLTEVVASCTGR